MLSYFIIIIIIINIMKHKNKLEWLSVGVVLNCKSLVKEDRIIIIIIIFLIIIIGIITVVTSRYIGMP